MGVVSVDDKEKFDTLQKYLLDEYVLVHIDPTREGVVIPAQLGRQPTVTLKLSKLFRGRLSVERHRIAAELLFGNEYFECQLPLNALWGITTVKGKTLLWPSSAPAEIVQTLAQQAQSVEAATPPAEEGTSEELTTVKAATAADPIPGSKKRKANHLKLIK